MIVMTPRRDRGARSRRSASGWRRLGLHVLVMPGELTTAIGAIGDPEARARARASRAWRASTASSRSRARTSSRRSELFHDGPSVFDIAGRTVGGNKTFCLIAGPCTVETREQTIDGRAHGQGRAAPRCCAAAPTSRARRRSRSRASGRPASRSSPRRARRPGCRSSPSCSTRNHADVIHEHADVVQIGARNMQNYALLEVAGKLGLPVLLKRGLSSSLDELLMAADYILKEGNERVMLCERGIRTFETATRFTLDLSAVPWLKLPHAPAGDRRPEPRDRRPPAGRAAGARRRRGRRRRHHRRGPQGPRGRALRRRRSALYAHDFPDFARRVAAHAALDGKDRRASCLARAAADRRVGEPREELALGLLGAELRLEQ